MSTPERFAQLDREIWAGDDPLPPEPDTATAALEEVRAMTREMASVLGDMAGMITKRLDQIEARLGGVDVATNDG